MVSQLPGRHIIKRNMSIDFNGGGANSSQGDEQYHPVLSVEYNVCDTNMIYPPDLERNVLMSQPPLPPRWQEVADYVAQLKDPVGNPMDPGIIEAVVALNLLGVTTTGSCEGHLDHGLAAPWIDFHTPGTGATRRKVNEITVRLQQAEEQHAPQKTIDDLTREYFLLAAEAEKDSFYGPWIVEQALIAFYHNKHVEHDRQIFIHSDSFGISRLQSHGIDYQSLQTPPQRAANLAAYQREMQNFATFLKTDYLLKFKP